METNLSAVAVEVMRSGGIPALAVLVLLTGGLAIAWRRAGAELRNPPPAAHAAGEMAALREEIKAVSAALHARVSRVEGRTDGAHSRIDAIMSNLR